MIHLPALKIITLAVFDVTAKCDPNKANKQYNFFNFPHWWQYIHSGQLDGLGNCVPQPVLPNGLWAIGLAITDMLLYLAGIVAVLSIIIAGIGYITAAGSSDKITSSRKRIINSLLGLAIVIVASAVVSFIGNTLG